ncbi:hypothetical protein DFJ58DRAFT_759273 [Suillus subalutaceus]|uniref:uncharacterized protein n=1 Tax=Suillus subalutaceus TaxID=48586 RepID=UPI001B882065|nr:uncharacterized protein DFJ58DRAFT_759273 [Suillus subalutaceus]KAG1873620.1 hypothetical protein DFJ58DRAFT_759273 [Suillus subalutaceus]
MSRLKDDPRWFSYTDACCAENLSALSAPVLRGVARRIGTKRSDARNKERSVDAIVSHFASRRTELASMSDDILFKSLLTASVPPACTRSRGTLLAAEFQNLYGLNLATTLVGTPPIISAPPLSYRKTCDALANHARQRALHLFHAGASVLDKAAFYQILAHEFGVLVTGRLSQEIVSRSVKDMLVHLECK